MRSGLLGIVFFTALMAGFCSPVSSDELMGFPALDDPSPLQGSSAKSLTASGSYSVGSVRYKGIDLPLGGALGLSSITQAARWNGLGELQLLGYLPGSAYEWSLARAVSDNGAIVIGTGKDSASKYQAFKWTEADGMVGLGFLSNSFDDGSMANSISGDGAVIIGSSWNLFNGVYDYRAFRWTSSGGMVGLGNMPGSASGYSKAYGINPDGSIIVGVAENASDELEAFRWTGAGGMSGLGFLPGAQTNASLAIDISSDGTTIVGTGINANGVTEAFRWSEGAGMTGLGIVGQISQSEGSWARAVNRDGTVVVGGVGFNSFSKGFAPDIEDSLTPDEWVIGSIGVGCVLNLIASPVIDLETPTSCILPVTPTITYTSPRAFRWTVAEGIRSISDILTENGIDLGDWQLYQANGVSDDGLIVVGDGKNPDGDREGWWAKIDTGFLSEGQLSNSLASLAGVGQSTQQSTSNGLGDVMNVATNGNSSDSEGSMRVWGGFGVSTFNVLKIDPYTLNGSIGITHQTKPDIRVGAGFHFGTREDHLPVYDGSLRNERMGIDLLVAYEPEGGHLRAYSALVADTIQQRVRRGYLNGVVPTSSVGERAGKGFGASFLIGWEMESFTSTSIMPFIGYEVSRSELDGYTETTGPFPIRVDALNDTLQIVRLGSKLRQRISGDVEIWGIAGLSHRVEERMPGASGEVIALSLPFNIPGATMRQNWGEGTIGLVWSLADGVDVHASFGATTDGDTAPLTSTRFGISMPL